MGLGSRVSVYTIYLGPTEGLWELLWALCIYCMATWSFWDIRTNHLYLFSKAALNSGPVSYLDLYALPLS